MSTRRLRVIAAAMVASLSLVVVACGGDDSGGSSSSSSGSSSKPTGTLKISGLNSDKPALQAAIKLFQQKYPDVKITTTWADPDQYQPALRTQLTGGTAADFIQIWPGAGNSAAISVLQPAGLLEDLSDRPWASKIPEGLKPVLTVDGKVYGLAVTVSGIGAIFDDQSMKKIGAKAPTTWSEVLDLCATAKKKGMVAFALGQQDSWVGQLTPYALATQMLYSDKPDFDRSGDYQAPHFAGSPWEGIEDNYVKMKNAGCFQDDANGTDYNTSLKMVAQGKALGVIQGNWAIAELKGVAKNATFSLHPLPASDNADETRMSAGASGTYGVNKNAKNKTAALAFIDFLASPEGMDAFAKVQNGLPGIPNEQYQLDPSLKSLSDYFNSGKTYPFMDQLWPNPDVQTAHLDGLQGVFDGSKSPQDVLKDMDKAWAQGPA
jgi:raffinose/stachyose/melibiose transport system substrate-binding protein